jgi:hypothetical protein
VEYAYPIALAVHAVSTVFWAGSSFVLVAGIAAALFAAPIQVLSISQTGSAEFASSTSCASQPAFLLELRSAWLLRGRFDLCRSMLEPF